MKGTGCHGRLVASRLQLDEKHPATAHLAIDAAFTAQTGFVHSVTRRNQSLTEADSFFPYSLFTDPDEGHET